MSFSFSFSSTGPGTGPGTGLVTVNDNSTASNDSPLSANEVDVVGLASTVSSSLSLCGCVFLLLTFALVEIQARQSRKQQQAQHTMSKHGSAAHITATDRNTENEHDDTKCEDGDSEKGSQCQSERSSLAEDQTNTHATPHSANQQQQQQQQQHSTPTSSSCHTPGGAPSSAVCVSVSADSNPESDGSLINEYHFMLFWLSLTELIDALTYLVGRFYANDPNICLIQGALMHFSELSVCYWSSFMALELYVILVMPPHVIYAHPRHRQAPKNRCVRFLLAMYQRRHTLYKCLAWGCPVLVIALQCSIIGTVNAYDQSFCPWCFISNDYPLARLLCYYSFLILSIVFCIFVYIRLHRFLSNPFGSDQSHMPSKQRSARTRIMLYPIIFVFLYSFAVIDRGYQWATDSAIYELVLLHSISSPLQGFVNAVAYGAANGKLKRLWFTLFCPADSDDTRVNQSVMSVTGVDARFTYTKYEHGVDAEYSAQPKKAAGRDSDSESDSDSEGAATGAGKRKVRRYQQRQQQHDPSYYPPLLSASHGVNVPTVPRVQNERAAQVMDDSLHGDEQSHSIDSSFRVSSVSYVKHQQVRYEALSHVHQNHQHHQQIHEDGSIQPEMDPDALSDEDAPLSRDGSGDLHESKSHSGVLHDSSDTNLQIHDQDLHEVPINKAAHTDTPNVGYSQSPSILANESALLRATVSSGNLLAAAASSTTLPPPTAVYSAALTHRPSRSASPSPSPVPNAIAPPFRVNQFASAIPVSFLAANSASSPSSPAASHRNISPNGLHTPKRDSPTHFAPPPA